MQDQIDQLITLALAEDVGPGDVTAASVVPADTRVTGILLAKEAGVLAGLDAVARVFRTVDPRIAWEPAMADGDALVVGDVVGRLAGPARSVLTAERTALNLLQRLSGVATATRRYVDAVAGTGATLVDTRKTTPGMRVLEKAAVRAGGGSNHRVGLFDGILIKDNHLLAVGGDITLAVRRARAGAPHTLRVEVEIDDLAQLEPAIAAGADIVMLDNMDVATMREAVARAGGRVLLEASGGVRLETVGAIAATGVDLISVGALTHSAPALDISLDLDLHVGA